MVLISQFEILDFALFRKLIEGLPNVMFDNIDHRMVPLIFIYKI